MSIYFSEKSISAFFMFFFIGVIKPIVKSGMLFVLGVSESLKGVGGVMGESGVASLFEVAKDKLLLKT